MSVVHPICCGLDVHKKKISACILRTGMEIDESTLIREFATFTDEIEQLRNWIAEHERQSLACRKETRALGSELVEIATG